MIKASRQPDGSILAPKHAHSIQGEVETVGIGTVVLYPGDPEYDQWDQWLRQHSRDSFARRVSDDIGRQRG